MVIQYHKKMPLSHHHCNTQVAYAQVPGLYNLIGTSLLRGFQIPFFVHRKWIST